MTSKDPETRKTGRGRIKELANEKNQWLEYTTSIQPKYLLELTSFRAFSIDHFIPCLPSTY
ncbi:conserved hypothetical protein [Ricinus communis]|uniref:Uncharacterized protein n=1 Tax=Ricinus communis TaxID=3988 RepID=B9SXN4_RICCO|nr:conserved hypothetical protein [Ricinus communis]